MPRDFRLLYEKIAAVLARLAFYRAVATSVALVLALAFTYSTWQFARNAAENEAHIRFEFRARQIREAIRDRMIDYEQVLRGGAGLFAASESVERGEWRAYVERLRIREIYPGIQGIGFATRVPADRKEQHERGVRHEGFPEYAIRPAGKRPEYAPIVYLEPFAGRNLRAFGFDMYSEPVRRAAMALARDSGEPVVSGKVTLVQETDTDVQTGFLMYLPVYRNGATIETVAQREATLTGWVYSPFRMSNLMHGILGSLSDVRLQVFDWDSPSAEALLFDSAPDSASRAHVAHFEVTESLPVRGRNWTVRVGSLSSYEATIDRTTPRLVAAASGAISALVLFIIWSLATLRARAVRLARSMTRELRESREQLGLALEGSNLALFDWNVASGEVLLSEQWGRILDGELGRTRTTIGALQALLHPDDAKAIEEKVRSLLAGESRYYETEHRVRAKTGGWKWILSRAKVAERDASGRALRVAGTNADISDRKEIERLKNEFIATVSHELRTPLTAIVGALGLLKELSAGRLSTDAATFLNMAQQNSERLAALINDILDMEKIESGQMDFRVESLAIRSLLERAVALNAPYAEKLGVRYELAQPLPDVAVAGDADRLLQVLTNLMSNAAKFSPAGSAITISAAARAGAVRIAVADRGPGVPEAFRGRIFEKFAQADGSDTRSKGGTGLGLSISKAIVEKLGGTMGYESTPGAGATFYIELPLREA